MKFGLDITTIEKINRVLAHYEQVEKAVLYGSRAKGNFKNGSDIDLALLGDQLNLSVMNKISSDLDDLLLPYSFDLSIFSNITNRELVEHIKRVGKIFYQK